MNNRDNSPQYKEWRLAVLKRDHFKCKKCGKKKKVYAHHIKSWADHAQLRYCVSNGVSLCYWCHKMITGNEESYERMCYSLLAGSKMKFKLGQALYENKDV